MRLVAIFSLASQLHQHVNRITASTICKPSQVIKIASVASQLDELVDGVLVTLLCLLPQLHQIGIEDGRTSNAPLVCSGDTAASPGTLR